MGRACGPVRAGPAGPASRPGRPDAVAQLGPADLPRDDPGAARRGPRDAAPTRQLQPGRQRRSGVLIPARRLSRQFRLVPALLVPTARAVGWVPALAAFALSLGLLALAVRPDLALPPAELVRWLRLAMIVAALGYAFLLDDPSEPTTEGVAGSLLLRRSLRLALLDRKSTRLNSSHVKISYAV